MELDYGAVKVVKGKYKGMIGYYDNNETYNRALVYRGEAFSGNYVLIPLRNLSDEITVVDLKERRDFLKHKIFQEKRKENADFFEIDSLHEELHFVENLLNDKYLHHYIWSRSVNKKVFISHASKDTQFAIDLAVDLSAFGINVWLDKWDIQLGQSIPKEITEGLENSDAVIMLYSEAYKKSAFCNDEWEAFYTVYNKKKPYAIIAVLLDDTEPPIILGARKYFDYKNSLVGYDDLLLEIKGALENLNN